MSVFLDNFVPIIRAIVCYTWRSDFNMRRIVLNFGIFLLAFGTACDPEIPEAVIPFTFVNEDINLTNIQYLNLKNQGGYIYYNAGFKGLIIYHESNDVYKVFERACTFDPKSDCTALEVDGSGLFIKHECCKSNFDFYGNPTGGPANIRLVQYYALVDGIYLKIRND